METSTAFSALYRDTVLAHGRAPRGVGDLAAPARRATVHNALCGDRITLALQLDGHGHIIELRHQTAGCLLCTASASLMADDVVGLDATAVASRHAALQSGIRRGDGTGHGELAALTGVSAAPSRHRCVLLPWEALRSALQTPECSA